MPPRSKMIWEKKNLSPWGGRATITTCHGITTRTGGPPPGMSKFVMNPA